MNHYAIGHIFNWTGNKLFPSEAKAKRDNLATVKLGYDELGCNKHSVITNRFLGQIVYFSIQINPLITN